MKHLSKKSRNIFKTIQNGNIFLGIFMLVLITSCQQSNKLSEKIFVNEVATEESSEETIVSANNKTQQNLKIIRSANVKYKVKDVKVVTKLIQNMVITENGYISDMRFSNNLYQKNNAFTIKIPQNKFDIILDSIANFALFIDYENITSKDVTEEYVDIQTRLKTKIEIKNRYETILRKRAKTVEEILATEDKLRIIQEEIEASQGKLHYLSTKVSLSTIEVILYEKVDYKEESISYSKTYYSKIKNGFSYGWDLIGNIFIGIIYIWPLLFIAILGFYFYKKKK